MMIKQKQKLKLQECLVSVEQEGRRLESKLSRCIAQQEQTNKDITNKSECLEKVSTPEK